MKIKSTVFTAPSASASSSVEKQEIRTYSSESNAKRAASLLRKTAKHASIFKTVVTDRRRKDFNRTEYAVLIRR